MLACFVNILQSLGQLGRVERYLNDGSVMVKVNGRRWALDPRCLVPAPGEQPQDEESEGNYTVEPPTRDPLTKLLAPKCPLFGGSTIDIKRC